MVKQSQPFISNTRATINFDKTTKTDYLPSIQSMSQTDSKFFETSIDVKDSLKDSLKNAQPKPNLLKKQSIGNKVEFVENPFYKESKPTNILRGNKLIIPISNFKSSNKEIIPMYRKVQLPTISKASSGKKKKLNESLEDSLDEEAFNDRTSENNESEYVIQNRFNNFNQNLSDLKTINSMDLSAVKSGVSPQTNKKPSFMEERDDLSDDSINVREYEESENIEETKSEALESVSEVTVNSVSFADKSSLNDRASMSAIEVSGISNLKKSFQSIEYSGKIKKIKLLGSGSEAKVYLCEITELKQIVALKEFLHIEQDDDKTYLNLKAQFGLLKMMEHENIINYYALYKPQKEAHQNYLEYGFIMEYLPGGSLEKLIAESFETLGRDDKKHIMYQILQGVNYLHQKKVIHRDLKPDNILLTEDKKKIKICDFGISVLTKNSTTIERSMVGTPWYMAPEVIAQEAYSTKADIWSLGCCFLHIITGQKPYCSLNGIQALMKIVVDCDPLISYKEKEIEEIGKYEGFDEVLKMCFKKDQKLRANTQELLDTTFFTKIFDTFSL